MIELPIGSRSVELDGPAGRLEGLLEPPAGELRGAAVICHPHPQHGGNMHGKVVYRSGKAAREAGLAALRFNFRGVGRSQGQSEGSDEEMGDVRAAIDFMADRYAERPLFVGGFSFGSAVGMKVARHDCRVTALFGLGLPLQMADFSYLSREKRPLCIIQGENDEFGSGEQVRELASLLGKNLRLLVIPDADHFFEGRLEQVQRTFQMFCSEVLENCS